MVIKRFLQKEEEERGMAVGTARGGAENREMNKNNDLKAFFFLLVLCFPFCRCSAEPVQLAP